VRAITPRFAFRQILSGDACISPASVYDPLSARAAAALGYELAMLAGSVASLTVLGAPDLVVLTLTELAEQCRRITRVLSLPLLVDADHGFGNALNVIRCVQELEAAGVAALTIEDTLLPRPFGATGDQVISLPEAVGKLRAALSARGDAELAVLGRTSALRVEGLDGCRERVSAYAATGVDGIFLVGARERAEIEALREVTDLPFVLGSATAALQDRAWLAAQGVRVLLLGHAPVHAAVKAMYETLAALREGTAPAELRDRVAAPALIAEVTSEGAYDAAIRSFLGG